MIQVTDKSYCSGCSACANICSVNAIQMTEDFEGFLYPSVNVAICFNCGKCDLVCPYNSSIVQAEDLERCYAAYNKDEKLRAVSSSGGIFAAIAINVIDNGGVVCGAVFDDDFNVFHSFAGDKESLLGLIGSKYTQSRIGDVYREVKKYLDSDVKVMFVGTTCQTAGLRSYLQYSNTDSDKLLSVDLICMGIPSPKIWREYLHNFHDRDSIKHINFKDKTSGWRKFSLKISGDNGNYIKIGTEDPFFIAYFKGLYSRPSCYSCKFKHERRASDITIADCWGSDFIAPELDDNKGLSSVIIHSPNGITAFDAVKESIVFKEATIEDIKKYNENYCRPRQLPKLRQAFWHDYAEMSFRTLFEKYCVKKILLEERAIRLIKNLVPQNISRLLLPAFWLFQRKKCKEMIKADKRFNETFRFSGKSMPRKFKRSPEWKIIVAYRKFQANSGNIWGRFYSRRLEKLEAKNGVHFENNLNIGKGLIIGHYGRIIINGQAKFGEQIFITHGVTIGRDVRGKRKGVPTIGNRVCIRAGASIVGKITIGDDVLIAPNAFVNFDVPSNSVVVGNPGQIHHRDNATEGHLGDL